MPAIWPLQPALAQTMLLVEDSRIAAEAVRLICRRLGVRLRRADCLELAQAHLRVYRPDLVLVDPGLPDGSGLSLIAALDRARWRPARIVGFSGDPAMDAPCRHSGADAFIAKPLQPAQHLPVLFGKQAADAALPAAHSWQSAMPCEKAPLHGALPAGGGQTARVWDGAALPGHAGTTGAAPDDATRCRNQGTDPLALQDDLRRARAMLCDARSPGRIGFAARFLGGIARCAGDAGLMRAAERALASGNAAPLLAALDGRMRDNLDCI
ncbi:MAG: response regulator [Pararhodobacter sp.]|nr:response regulator [Pararhodobacter sp.]